MTSHESFSVSPCVSPLLSKGPMGLRGYPGMMGPKGEAVSTTVSLLLSHLSFFALFLFG